MKIFFAHESHRVSPPAMDEEDEDVMRIKRGTVEIIRNSLLRHHDSRSTDKAYQESAACKQTTEILQTLNAALQRRIPSN